MEFIMKKTLLLSFLSIAAINGLATSQAQAFDWIKYSKPVAHLTAGAAFTYLSGCAAGVAYVIGKHSAFPTKKLFGSTAIAGCLATSWVTGKIAAENFSSLVGSFKALFR